MPPLGAAAGSRAPLPAVTAGVGGCDIAAAVGDRTSCRVEVLRDGWLWLPAEEFLEVASRSSATPGAPWPSPPSGATLRSCGSSSVLVQGSQNGPLCCSFFSCPYVAVSVVWGLQMC